MPRTPEVNPNFVLMTNQRQRPDLGPYAGTYGDKAKVIIEQQFPPETGMHYADTLKIAILIATRLWPAATSVPEE